MKKLRVALIQAKITYDKKKSDGENDMANYKHALKLLRKFRKNTVDLIAFPEFYPGNEVGQIKDMKELHEEAKRINSYILCGEIERSGKKYNSETLVSPKGKIAGRYHKIKLWIDEKNHGISPGNKLKIFKIRGVNVGIITCFEINFASFFEELKDMGAEVIIHPAQKTPMKLDAWKGNLIYLSNTFGMPIAAVNCCLYKGSTNNYYGGGGSRIVMPTKLDFGKFTKPASPDKYTAKKLGSKEGILKYAIEVGK